MMRRWIEVCGIDELPRLGARVVRREAGADVAVFRAADDRVFALLDRCPHKGGPLSQGIVFGHRVACPLHAWTIELSSGEAVAPDRGCARRFAVRVDDGRVYLDADELALPAGPAPAGAGAGSPGAGPGDLAASTPGNAAASTRCNAAALAPGNAANPNGLAAGPRVAAATAG